jgi:hypothetical protein
LLPQNDEAKNRIDRYTGQKAVVWGTVFRGATIYMRQAIAATSVFGPNDPMPMTLIAIPEYPCPGDPKPPVPVPPQTIELLPGEIGAIGTLVWENGRPVLETPSGRILLTIPPQVAVPGAAEPSTPGGPSGDPKESFPSPVRPQLMVIAAGKWSIAGGQLVITVRYLRPWPSSVVIEPPPPPPPAKGAGTLYGQVRIGPLCPV